MTLMNVNQVEGVNSEGAKGMASGISSCVDSHVGHAGKVFHGRAPNLQPPMRPIGKVRVWRAVNLELVDSSAPDPEAVSLNRKCDQSLPTLIGITSIRELFFDSH
jgi:hypothetical protein